MLKEVKNQDERYIAHDMISVLINIIRLWVRNFSQKNCWFTRKWKGGMIGGGIMDNQYNSNSPFQ